MRILLLSTIPAEREGRITRLINTLIAENELTIMSPKSNYCIDGAEFITIVENIPKGYKDQINYLFKIIKIYKKLIHKDYDLIYICNYTSVPFGLYLANKMKMKIIIYDAFELIIKTRIEKKTFRDLVYLHFESKVLKLCNAVICANKERALIMQGYYRLNDTPFVVSNLPTNVGYIELNECLNREKREFSNYITITYVGYISNTRKLSNLVDEVALLGNKYQLSIYGHGDYLQQLGEMILKNGYTNIQVFGKYNQADLKDILSRTDIGYIYYPDKGLNNIYCEPNKIYDYSMYCVPMISYFHPTLFEKLNSNKIGISSDDIKNSIITISNNIAEYKKNCFDFMIRQNTDSNSIVINRILKKVVKKLEKYS